MDESSVQSVPTLKSKHLTESSEENIAELVDTAIPITHLIVMTLTLILAKMSVCSHAFLDIMALHCLAQSTCGIENEQQL